MYKHKVGLQRQTLLHTTAKRLMVAILTSAMVYSLAYPASIHEAIAVEGNKSTSTEKTVSDTTKPASQSATNGDETNADVKSTTGKGANETSDDDAPEGSNNSGDDSTNITSQKEDDFQTSLTAKFKIDDHVTEDSSVVDGKIISMVVPMGGQNVTGGTLTLNYLDQLYHINGEMLKTTQISSTQVETDEDDNITTIVFSLLYEDTSIPIGIYTGITDAVMEVNDDQIQLELGEGAVFVDDGEKNDWAFVIERTDEASVPYLADAVFGQTLDQTPDETPDQTNLEQLDTANQRINGTRLMVTVADVALNTENSYVAVSCVDPEQTVYKGSFSPKEEHSTNTLYEAELNIEDLNNVDKECDITVYAEDVASNKITKTYTVKIDNAAPLIEDGLHLDDVEASLTNGSYYQVSDGSETANLWFKTDEELNLDSEKTYVEVYDGSEVREVLPIEQSETDEQTYVFSVDVKEEPISITLALTDQLDNTNREALRLTDITFDNRDPTVLGFYVSEQELKTNTNETLYVSIPDKPGGDKVSVAATVEELNFDAEATTVAVKEIDSPEEIIEAEWSSNGSTHTTTIAGLNDGEKYKITVTPKDLSGRVGESSSVEFVVDLTEPEGAFGIEGTSTYADNVGKTTYNVYKSGSLSAVRYELSEATSFDENKIQFTDTVDKVKDTSNLGSWDQSEGPQHVFAFDQGEIVKEGLHTITVSGKDGSGHDLKEDSITYLYDATAPHITSVAVQGAVKPEVINDGAVKVLFLKPEAENGTINLIITATDDKDEGTATSGLQCINVIANGSGYDVTDATFTDSKYIIGLQEIGNDDASRGADFTSDIKVRVSDRAGNERTYTMRFDDAKEEVAAYEADGSNPKGAEVKLVQDTIAPDLNTNVWVDGALVSDVEGKYLYGEVRVGARFIDHNADILKQRGKKNTATLTIFRSESLDSDKKLYKQLNLTSFTKDAMGLLDDTTSKVEELAYYARTDEGLKDGHYKLVASVKDLNTNEANAQSEFTVDNTPPKLLSVVWKSEGRKSANPVETVTVEDGTKTEYFDAVRSVTITVQEHNFYLSNGQPCIAFNTPEIEEPTWVKVDGRKDTYRFTYTFTEDGPHGFSFVGQDQAGQKLEAMDSNALTVIDGRYDEIPFVIDTQNPVIANVEVGTLVKGKREWRELEDNECIASTAKVRVFVEDANFKPETSVFAFTLDQAKQETSYSTNEWVFDKKTNRYYVELDCTTDGAYHFAVTANDYCPAHEQVENKGTLRVDLEKPLVTVSYEAVDEDDVASGVKLSKSHMVDYYSGMVRETIIITDRNLDVENTSIELSGGTVHTIADLQKFAKWSRDKKEENEIVYEQFEETPRDSEGNITYSLKVVYDETPSIEDEKALFERIRPTITVYDDAKHTDAHKSSVNDDYFYVVDQRAPTLVSSSINADPSPSQGYSKEKNKDNAGAWYFFNAESARMTLEFTDNHEIASITLDDGEDKVYVSELHEKINNSRTTTVKKGNFGFEATINNARTDEDGLAKVTIGFDLLDGEKNKPKNTELERNFELIVTDRAGNYHRWTIENGVVYDRHSGTRSESKATPSVITTPGSTSITSPFALVRDTTKPKITLSLLDQQGSAVRLSKAKAEEGHIFFDAPKTFQVDVHEYNFSYMQDYMPNAVVATVGFNTARNNPNRDKSESTALTVCGKNAMHNSYFQQVDESDCCQWRATYPLTMDGDYSIEAGFEDIAQNESGLFKLPNDQNPRATKVTIDTVSPSFAVTWNDAVVPVKGGTAKTKDKAVYYDKYRTATIVVTEHNFDPKRMTPHITLDAADVTNKVYSSANWKRTPDTDIYTLTIPFKKDGDYTFSFEGTDRAGNKAKYDAKHSSAKNNSTTKDGAIQYIANPFSIDTTSPVLTVTYKNNEPNVFKKTPYYKSNRSVTISINERYWNQNMISITTSGKKTVESNWSSTANNHQTAKSNTIHTITYEFGEGDDHTLVVSGRDKALNQMVFNKDVGTTKVGGITTGGTFSNHTYRAQRFTVDKTAPVIYVTFDENNPAEVDGMQYYASKRLATVHVVEHCWDNSYFKISTRGGKVLKSTKEGDFRSNDGNWYTKNDDHTAKVLFDEGDELQLTVVGRDLATNAAEFKAQDASNTPAKFNGVAYDPRDELGNKGYRSKRFFVDLTDPVINVRFDNNEGMRDTVDDKSDQKMYYKSRNGRTATITVTEHNFRGKKGTEFFTASVEQTRTVTEAQYTISEPKTKGDVTTYTVMFPKDGDYTLTVVGKDLASRKAVYDVNDKSNTPAQTNGSAYKPKESGVAGYQSHPFVIDHTVPEVLVEAVNKGQSFNNDDKTSRPYYNDEHDIRITIKDRNLVNGTAGVKINGVVYTNIAWKKQSVDANSVDIGTWSTAMAEDATVTYTAQIDYKETPNDRDCFYTPSVSVVDKAGNENTAYQYGTETEFVNDFTAPTIDKVDTDQLPTSDHEMQYQFYNEPTALRFDISDSHDLQMAAMADADNEYNFDAVINTDNDRYADRNTGYLAFSLKDGVSSDNNTEFDNQAKFTVTDVAGNTRTWTVDPSGTVIEESVSKEPREVANKDLRDEGTYPTKLIQDEVKPVITLTPTSIQGGYYNTPQTVHVAVDEFNFAYLQQFAPDRVIFTVHKENGSAGRTSSGWDHVATDFSGSGSSWEYDQVFSDDGHYSVTAQFKDFANNESDEKTISEFTIDRTGPEINVSWDNDSVQNDKYYMASRTATITITEHNFDASRINISSNGSIGSWANNGDTHTITVSFADEGTYNLSVDGSDMAGNTFKKYVADEFVIDLSQPSISFGILHGTKSSMAEQEEPNETAWNDKSINVAMHLSDANFNSEGVTTSEVVGVNTGTRFVSSLDSKDNNQTVSFAIKNDVGADDIYDARVEVQDLAGNTNASEFTFSVNRYGSTWRVTSVDVNSAGEDGNLSLNLEDGSSITSVVEQLAKQNDGILPGSPAITVEEINVTGAADEDRHVLVTSLEGNTSMGNAVRELQQVSGGKGPGYELNNLGAAKSDTMAREGKTGWNVGRYLIHADSFGATDNKALDGRYIVSMSSNDKATLNNAEGNNNRMDKYYSRVLSGDQSGSYLKETENETPEVLEGYDIKFTRDSTGPQVLGMSNPGVSIGDETMVSFTLEDDVQAPGGDSVKVSIDTYTLGGPQTQSFSLVRAERNGSTTYVDAHTGKEVEGLTFDGDKTFQLKIDKKPFAMRQVEVVATDYAKRESGVQTDIFYVSNLLVESAVSVAFIAAVTTVFVVRRKKKEKAEAFDYE